MNIKIHQINGNNIAELLEDSFIIGELQDAIDLLAESNYLGAGKIVIHENQLPADFFDLKTGLAGEILQKVSNYRMHLAVAGDFSRYKSKSLKDFIRESNRIGRILFVQSVEEGLDHFSK